MKLLVISILAAGAGVSTHLPTVITIARSAADFLDRLGVIHTLLS